MTTFLPQAFPSLFLLSLTSCQVPEVTILTTYHPAVVRAKHAASTSPQIDLTLNPSLLITAALVASGEGMAVETNDYHSAFLNCEMPEDIEEAIVRLDQFMTLAVTEIAFF